MVLATFFAGVMLVAAGLLRLGGYVRLVTYPVTIGFTAGIAGIIMISQIKELLGLTLEGAEPGPVLEKLIADVAALDTANLYAAGVALSTIALIIVLRRLRPQFPGVLVAVSIAAVAVAIFDLPADTIGTRFGELPRGLPPFTIPTLSAEKGDRCSAQRLRLFPAGRDRIAFVRNGRGRDDGRRHRSNCELAAQGVANIASSLFGGMVVTGTIARTATNIRAGAHGPVAGMLQAVYLLVSSSPLHRSPRCRACLSLLRGT